MRSILFSSHRLFRMELLLYRTLSISCDRIDGITHYNMRVINCTIFYHLPGHLSNFVTLKVEGIYLPSVLWLEDVG
jgi:hypothetical protein